MIIFASFCCFYGRPSSKRSKYLCVFREPLTAVHRRRRDIASSPSIRLSAVIVTHTLSITHLYLQRRLHTYFYYYFMAFSYFVDIFFTYVAADEGDREKGEEKNAEYTTSYCHWPQCAVLDRTRVLVGVCLRCCCFCCCASLHVILLFSIPKPTLFRGICMRCVPTKCLSVCLEIQ